MDGGLALLLARTLLGLHIGLAALVVFGLVAIPLGARLGWTFIYSFWWRAAHLGALLVIALQKVLGKICFLSVWEFALLERAGRGPFHVPVIHSWAENIIYWDLPLWVLTALYLAGLTYALWLWRRVPPRRPALRLQ